MMQEEDYEGPQVPPFFQPIRKVKHRKAPTSSLRAEPTRSTARHFNRSEHNQAVLRNLHRLLGQGYRQLISDPKGVHDIRLARKKIMHGIDRTAFRYRGGMIPRRPPAFGTEGYAEYMGSQPEVEARPYVPPLRLPPLRPHTPEGPRAPPMRHGPADSRTAARSEELPVIRFIPPRSRL